MNFTNTILYPPFDAGHRVGIEVCIDEMNDTTPSFTYIYLLCNKYRYEISYCEYKTIYNLLRGIYCDS